jgi:CPA1 family monovalent cation:H+ antiporter
MLLTISAAFAFLNAKFVRLPTEIGVLVMGLVASLLLIGVELLTAETEHTRELTEAVRQIDFQASLMNGMLAFMLFAGALHVDWAKLRSRAPTVALLATVGVLISTAIVGTALWLAAGWLGTPIPLAWALVFGALISPTDPVAVLSTLKSVRVPEDLQVEMSGEALLNDGLLIGHATYRAMRAIDDYTIEVLITLAAVMATYSLAGKLHLSGPIAVVCAGILIGERGPRDAMSEATQRYVFGFWTLADALLNIVLFLLIGLEVLGLRPGQGVTTVALMAIPIVLVGRWVAVALPVTALRFAMSFRKGTIPVLTWGGVRGGISIALVLSMPDFPQRPMVLAATYAIVVFSIVVQGLTLGPLVRKVVKAD